MTCLDYLRIIMYCENVKSVVSPDSRISDGKTLLVFGNRNARLKYFNMPTLQSKWEHIVNK
jgi:hypothetical protein